VKRLLDEQLMLLLLSAGLQKSKTMYMESQFKLANTLIHYETNTNGEKVINSACIETVATL